MKKIIATLIVITAIGFFACDDMEETSPVILAGLAECMQDAATCTGDTYIKCNIVGNNGVIEFFYTETVDCTTQGLNCSDASGIPKCQ